VKATALAPASTLPASGRALVGLAVAGLLACASPPAPVTVASLAPTRAPAPAAPGPSAHPACAREVPSSCAGAPPAFATEVRPILGRRCFGCHAGDGEAAESHDFSRFATLFAQRSSVADEVTTCSMPPPGKAGLSEDEAATLLRWIACGAQGGGAGDP